MLKISLEVFVSLNSAILNSWTFHLKTKTSRPDVRLVVKILIAIKEEVMEPAL